MAEPSPGTEDADKKFVSEDQNAAPNEATEDVKPSDSASSSESTKDVELSSLDVVTAALKEESEDSSPSEEETESAEDSAESEGEGAADKPEKPDKGDKDDLPDETDENGKPLPFGKHPVWIKKHKQLAEARAELEELRPFKEQVEKLAPRAEALDTLREYASENNLSSGDVNDLFSVGSLIRNDPDKAIPFLEHYLAECKKATGRTLPDDLVTEVSEGRISLERATELSQTRSQAARSEEAAQTARDAAETRDAQSSRQVLSNQVETAVAAWEKTWQGKDPDFKVKVDRVLEKIKVFRMDNLDQLKDTPQEAVEIAQLALEAVNEELKQFAPRKTPTEVVPDGGITDANAGQKPSSSLDVVNMVLGG